MSSSKKVQLEAKRLERLRKDLENQQKKLDQEKAKLRAEKKEVAALRRKYEQSQKEMKARKNKLDQDKRRLDKTTPRSSPRSPSRGPSSTKLQAELADAKSRLEKKSGDLRNMRKQLEELKQRNKLLERQAKSGARGRANTNSDKKTRQLQAEISVLKKKIKLLLADLEKQRRYYQTQLKRFKNQQEKWIARQREAKAKKDIVIKYIFIDDIRTVKKYRKGKRKIKIITRDGEPVIVNQCDVIDATEVEEAMDDEQDEFIKEIESELKRTKKKKKKKKKGGSGDGDDGTTDDTELEDETNEDEPDTPASPTEYDDEKLDMSMPATLDELNEPNPDDVDPEDIPTEVNMTDQILALIEELESRTRDLHSINEIYENEGKDQQDDALKDLLETVTGRHEEWTDKLVNQNFEMKDELPTINKSWQDEIYSVCTTIAAASQPQKATNYGFSMSPVSQDNETKDVIDNLVSTNKELLTELQGRVGDIKHLNNIYFKAESKDNSEENGKSSKEEIDALLGDLDARHETINSRISELTESKDDSNLGKYVPSNNKDWRTEISNSLRNTENNEKEKEAIINELEQRKNDIENISKILNGDEPLSMFDEIINECKERHEKLKPKQESIYVNDENKENNEENGDSGVSDERIIGDNEKWLALLTGMKEQRMNSESKESGADGNNKELSDVVNEELIGEMSDRRKDLLKMTELSKLDAIPNEEIDNIIEEVTARQEAQKTKLRQCMKDKDLVNDNASQKLLEDIENDNKEWVALFQNNLKNDETTKLNLKKRNEIYMNELNGRIADLIKVKNIADRKDKQGASEEELQTTLDGIVDSAQERQKENETEWKNTKSDETDETKESSNESNNQDNKHYNEFVTNDGDWIDALGNASESIIGMKPQELKNSNYNENDDVLAGVVTESKEDGEDGEDDRWWLDKNDARRDFIDSIKLNDDSEDETKELKDDGYYLDRVLGNFADDDAITPLYIEIPVKDSHHILSVLYDGVLICNLINEVEPNFIDPRSVNTPDALNPMPLSKLQVAENIQLIMSSMKSLGIQLQNYDRDGWFDNETVGSKIIEILQALSNAKLQSNPMNPSKHPELMRLAKNNEIESKEIDNMSGDQWIQRWINNTLDRPVKDEVKTDEWNKDLFNVMSKLYPKFKEGAGGEFEENEDAACEYMVNFAKNNLKLNTNVKSEDLIGNNRKLQELFASELFDEDSGLSQLNKNELKEYQGFVKKDKNAPEVHTLSWINSMLPPDLRIKHLFRDLSDGIVLLKLLDRANPGCVQWTKKYVKTQPKTRFDKFQNCNYAMNTVIKSFPFARISGAKGEDFVNSEQKIHQKQVISFLWQLMRYHATKQLSQLSFGGKEVTETDIIQWANLKVSEFEDRVSTNLSSFRDPQLTTCVFYCELLEAVVPDSLNMSIVHTDLPPLKDLRRPDKHYEKRLANARYAMSMVRRLGGELFVMPEDLIAKEQKAVLSVFAAIMTIDMTGVKEKNMTEYEDKALNASTVPI